MAGELTQNQEMYAQARARGLTQRQAYREAYPRSKNWKDSAVDSAASRLEANNKVSARLAALNKQAAKRSVISKAKLLKRLDDLAEQVSDKIIEDFGDGLVSVSKDNADILIKSTKELLKYAPDDTHESETEFVRDFGLLLAPQFLEPHRIINDPTTKRIIDLWLGGGRGSTKSSFASLEVVNYLEKHPDKHATVFMKHKTNLRDGAYAQIVWAINELGLEDEYDMPDSTLRIRKKSTWQLILFRGVDNAQKIKSIKVPFGSIGIVWYEETDMFRGMKEIRSVNQSVTRGGNDAIRLYTYNPPRSKNNWVNNHVENELSDDAKAFSSTYLDVPKEWLGDQFISDAEHLKETDELSYQHEYLGLPVGNGSEVFDRVVFREITDDEIAQFDNIRCGQDFGWYPDPWAFVMSELRLGQRELLSFYEDGGNKLEPPLQAERIKKALTWTEADGKTYYHNFRVYSDDAEPGTISSQRDCSINARAAGKGNMRRASYQLLQSLTWVIDPKRCPHLAKEVRNMQYEVNKDGELLNSIPDGNDHWIDATRYSIMDIAERGRKAYRSVTPIE